MYIIILFTYNYTYPSAVPPGSMSSRVNVMNFHDIPCVAELPWNVRVELQVMMSKSLTDNVLI